MANPVRLMTWNVHSTFALNPSFDVRAALTLIEKWQPDIVALQEVDSRGRSENPFEVLADTIGGHSIHARSIVTADGHYGQFLASRWPWVREPAVLDISFKEREPRRAIGAEISTPAGCLHVVATHLGLSMRERRSQSRSLLQLARGSSCPTVVVGDFNDWFWAGSVRGILAKDFPVRTRFKTFPGGWPLLKLDRIYASSSITLARSFVDREGGRLSDHLPVIADIVLPCCGREQDELRPSAQENVSAG